MLNSMEVLQSVQKCKNFFIALFALQATVLCGLSDGVTVAQGPLEAFVLVRIQVGQPITVAVSEVTRILEAIQKGDSKAAGELLPLVYEELRRLAAHKMAAEAPGHTLQPTALVHEAWLRMIGKEEVRFAGRAHFFAAAAEAMRHILIDSARRKQAVRHGGGQA